ncbi:cell wall hydrolase [Qipengyuania aquimaris]|nr:cell wall hydrolase [Qipengyuania aquimaris]
MRKSIFGLAAGAAAMIATFAGAEETGAQVADATAETTAEETVLTDEVVPVFVSEEVVQELPEEASPEYIGDVPAAANNLRDLVAAMSAPEELTDEMRCLAGAVYFESRGEPLAGQLAVAQVVINRSESRRFPSSYCGVVYQRAQFSFVRGGTMPRIKTGSAAWARAKKIARIAHQGLWESEAEDSLYFHATYVNPRWASKKTRRAAIKTHIFYR